MAKKLKCSPDEMLSWMKIARESEKLQPDASKVTLVQVKEAVKTVFDEGKGCFPKPKGRAIGERAKELGAYKKTIEKRLGIKIKDLY
ncbi:MAG: hypothetical protein CEE42_04230 [Promethearchaeota archaeon Loki_b31]|nr:MAG: hypothetical protein CEE42_04230 [Candidatus Lokiarchaeota archaeon Loki_b31]